MAGVVRVGPPEDVRCAQPRKVMNASHSTVLSEEPGQARAPGKAAPSPMKGVCNPLPGLAGRFVDGAGQSGRPSAGARMEGIGPGQDLWDG
jgi:hypothetical protein